ncbi:cationic peptide transport system ATP-binding protein [Pseudidiomarina indica]|uniref:Cationic peptide transport system ATP-binding protein n=1 Tax=Pseudidiomarina indica TaxID=1159017 RepID=A0A1G6AAS9_9GAMM|nr:oligopeptide/dipeptide ABC transporter ATP-binding protein [Pseudidiomarina indica]SDB05565.1 cationic peptide transport system ATP-binding protein [Pseudidiomarina indica]
MNPILDIRNLTIALESPEGPVKVLDGFNLQLAEGEIHTLVGESGSGKSLLAKAILGFIQPKWRITADRLWWRQQDLLAMTTSQRRAITSQDMAMIFQNPASYLDPYVRVGHQLEEVMMRRQSTRLFRRKREQREQLSQLLQQVEIDDIDAIYTSYPSQLSDGVAQKIGVAMALAHRPKFLVADEPTSAMGPYTRHQIYQQLARLNRDDGMSILLITQDLTSMMPQTERLSFIYCGQLMEVGPKDELLSRPRHPYTDAMCKMSFLDQSYPAKTKLPTLPGAIPTSQNLPIGCRLGPRCPNAQRICVQRPELRMSNKRQFACHYPLGDGDDNE